VSTKKYEHLTSASRATASRDLIELAQVGLLRQEGAGRSTRYGLNIDGWDVML
jgi:Fic family protein